jgi:hypothetical protein
MFTECSYNIGSLICAGDKSIPEALVALVDRWSTQDAGQGGSSGREGEEGGAPAPPVGGAGGEQGEGGGGRKKDYLEEAVFARREGR